MGIIIPPLEAILDTIPEENQHRLNEGLRDRISRTKIAQSLGSNWREVAQYIPNITHNVIDDI